MSQLTLEEKLVILMEECAEVTKAASKCLRFGYHTLGPEDYGFNDEVLAREVGDLLAMIDSLHIPSELIGESRRTKISRAENAKEKYGRTQ
jgi:NTP pyrophosphatase (non-canonical NTP hydrolase)